MPTYEYKCSNCGTLEYYQSMFEASLVECPECNSTDFIKVINSVNVKFVGTGFYTNDSKSK